MNFFQRIHESLALAYQFIKAVIPITYGGWKISKLPQPCISIFGGSRLKKDSIYTKQAYIVAKRLVDNNISVLTGGGPGIMEAANCGAAHDKQDNIRTMGIWVRDLPHEFINLCVRNAAVILNYFFTRKWLLLNYSIGFIIFPGGFGTLDEFAELMTLIETQKLRPSPVVLIGTEYWKPYKLWIDNALREGLVLQMAVDTIKITDDIDYAIQAVLEHCKVCIELNQVSPRI
jgi:uncharacterized protein (TIGR00730 family)